MASDRSQTRLSLRARLVGQFLRHTVRPAMTRAHDPLASRRHFDLTARLWFRDVPHRVHLPVTDPKGAWVWVGQPQTEYVIFYIHGGGYFAGSPETHAKMLARLSKLTGLRCILPSYRRAPEFPLPRALGDVRAAFDQLLARGYPPENIVIGGDSAGGGLALSLLSSLGHDGIAPAACFAFSPFCDLTFSGDSVISNAASDHFFPGQRASELTEIILPDHPADDPKVSPLFARFPMKVPVFLVASESEILRDDAVRMAKALDQQSVPCEVQIYPDLPHVWPIFDGWFPEARRTLRQTARFIQTQLHPPNDS